MKKNFLLMFFLCLTCFFVATSAFAKSWAEEQLREFEELRLQQLQTVRTDGDIVPFASDGCSGSQSRIWRIFATTLPGFSAQFFDKPPWEACCVAHDKVYWRGDTVDGYAKRKLADDELRQCVIATGDRLAPELSAKYSQSENHIRQTFLLTADFMYQAVRLGGQPCSMLPWRWGYGWDNCAFAGTSVILENYSDVKDDEHVTFFNTAAWLDVDNAYWHIPIHAWIYEPQDSLVRKEIFATLLESKYDLKATPSTEGNFSRRTNLMIADNERGKTLVIRIAGQDISLPTSKEDGHVFKVLKLPIEIVNAFSDQGLLTFFAVTRPEDNLQFAGKVKLLARRGVSVISDIDDTIKVSNVTDHKRLLDNTFFKDFQEVAGMPDLYRQLAVHNAAIHFVSSSPWQLYGPLRDFVRDAGFPWATMSLKDVRFRDETLLNLFKKGTETKPDQIEPILQRYSERQFILIGDSGEQDPEVYGNIARSNPHRMLSILIRNVDSSSAEDERYQNAFKGIARHKWQLFDQPDQIEFKELLSNE